MLSAQFVVMARMLVAITFAGAVAGKIRSRRHFAVFADSLVPLGKRVMDWRPVAGSVVAAEVTVTVLVALPGTAGVGLAMASALLACFCVGIGSALRRGRMVSCRCFGSGGGNLRGTHLVRNAMLGTVAATGWLVLPHSAAVPLTGAAVLPALLLGGFLALLVIHWDEFVGLFAARDRS